MRLALLVAAVAILTGCGATSSPTSPAAAASARPTPSAAVSAPPSTPARSADPGTLALQRFVAFASKADASYQATFTGQSRHTTDILPISKGLLQVDGANVLVRATFTFPSGRPYVTEHRFVGGSAWIRYSPEPWERLRGFAEANSMAAFPAVHAATDVTYLGPKTVAGKVLYQVQVKSAIVHPVMIPAGNLTEESVTSPKLVVLVDAAGHPVRGTAEIRGRGRISRQLQEIVIDLELTFTKVGQPVKITAP
jgi:hypothetical protein